jgi:hypothetical protein
LLILYCEERSYFALLTLTVMFFSRKPRRHEIKRLEKAQEHSLYAPGGPFGRDVRTIYLFLFRCEIPN